MIEKTLNLPMTNMSKK